MGCFHPIHGGCGDFNTGDVIVVGAQPSCDCSPARTPGVARLTNSSRPSRYPCFPSGSAHRAPLATPTTSPSRLDGCSDSPRFLRGLIDRLYLLSPAGGGLNSFAPATPRMIWLNSVCCNNDASKSVTDFFFSLPTVAFCASRMIAADPINRGGLGGVGGAAGNRSLSTVTLRSVFLYLHLSKFIYLE